MKELSDEQLMLEVLASNSAAMYEWARRLMEVGREEDAVNWWKKGAYLGDPDCCYEIGNCYYIGFHVEENLGEAFYYYELVANQGHADAINNLADMYLNGEHVEADEKKALQLFEQAAAKQVSEAMFTLGMMYEKGLGTDVDFDKARYYYEQAAILGDIEAHYRIGSIYYEGLLDEPVDFAKALDAFKLAADGFHVDAQFNLGYMYMNGIGVELNGERALYYFKQAALQGDDSAAKYIVDLYEEGTLVKKNEVAAKKWRNKASTNL